MKKEKMYARASTLIGWKNEEAAPSPLNPSRERKIGYFLILFSLLSLVAVGCKKEAPQMPPATGAEAPPLPKLPKIVTGNQSGSISGTEGKTTGTTYPRQEAQIGPSVGGILLELAVEEGDRVKKGDVLFRQDARDAALRAQQAKAGLSAAQVGLRAVEIEYKRGEALIKDNAMNRAQWDQLQARYDGAKAGIEQAQVAVQMAEKMVNDAVVRAPFAGVVVRKLKSEGEMLTTMPPSVVLILQDQLSLDLRFLLPESALTKVKPGDRITARFAAIGQEREATILRVMPTVSQLTRTVEIVATIANNDLSLRPGLLAEVGFHENAAQAQGGQP
jgi:RND family efflux transporter MFP subunit